MQVKISVSMLPASVIPCILFCHSQSYSTDVHLPFLFFTHNTFFLSNNDNIRRFREKSKIMSTVTVSLNCIPLQWLNGCYYLNN
jgi:hypothetical protein